MYSFRKRSKPPKPVHHVYPEPPQSTNDDTPAPIKAQKVDFESYGMSEYAKKFALVIDNLFTQADCDKLLAAAGVSLSEENWEVAQINGGTHEYTDTTYRNSGRKMIDDHELANWILEKLRPYLSEIAEIQTFKTHGTHRRGPKKARLLRLNERLRFLRYGRGEFFKPHCDGAYHTPDGSEVSYYTLQIYINGDEASLEGGPTRFFALPDMFSRMSPEKNTLDVPARTGRVLIFEQNGMAHSGEEVSRGIKISMRTDFMYVLTNDEGMEE